MNFDIDLLQSQLDAPRMEQRLEAAAMLTCAIVAGKLTCAPTGRNHNFHCHTFFSYNGGGMSPTHVAFLAKRSGWFGAGVVDFDVLDAVAEFTRAARIFGLKYSCGMESRVYIDELADVEINSPGEPGVAYHLALGFVPGSLPQNAAAFADRLREQARARTRRIMELVNPVLAPVALDFDSEVAALTPAGNATERHLCLAYRLKAGQLFADAAGLVEFWAGKFGISSEEAGKLVANPVALEARIRSAFMKRGGPGYIKPEPSSFPPVGEMNSFALACGAIPAIAWLNGLSGGESDVDRLLDLHMSKGVRMLNLVPDRNWNIADPPLRDRCVAEMDRVIAACRQRGLPVVVGTEMNAPGLKPVDDFTQPVLARHLDTFVDGALCLYAHTLLTSIGRSFAGEWAECSFANLAARSHFYTEFGRRCSAARFEAVSEWPDDPALMLKKL